ncbi:MAG: single-stranded-DNA-specific exonuclease RecJ [Firmicutes bacterium]|nr:single-stranded-DNA-specific exonuclease RecJ [Bacillota bacterium]
MRIAVRPADRQQVARLAQTLGVQPLTASLLLQRGLITSQSANAFLQPAPPKEVFPAGLPHLDEAIRRLVLAVKRQEKVFVIGDYDADGVTAACILAETLRAAGLTPVLRNGSRFTSGYGFHVQQVDEAAQAEARLIVTLDAGTTAWEAASRAKALGIDVIVIDHHDVPEKLPPVFALINPELPNHSFPEPYPCSAGLAWGVGLALCRALGLPDRVMDGLLDLAAIGTVADVVPLLGINRSFVHYGIEALRRTRRPGLRRLYALLKLAPERIDARSIGFRIAPCINAAGRLEDPEVAVTALIAEPQQAVAAAERLVTLNDRRRALTEEVAAAAQQQVEAHPGPVTVAYGPWHPGVVGIVAGKLAQRYGKPSIVFGQRDSTTYTGSARSVEAIDIMDLLEPLRAQTLSLGGHPQAAGLTVSAEQMEAIAAQLQQIEVEAPQQEPIVWADASVRVATFVHPQVVRELSYFPPFGEGNPEPLFAMKGRVKGLRRMGPMGEHLRFWLKERDAVAPLVWFSAPSLEADSVWLCLVSGRKNQWQGESSWEGIVERGIRGRKGSGV